MQKSHIRSNKLNTIIKKLYDVHPNKSVEQLFEIFTKLNHNFDDNIYNLFFIHARNISDIDDIIKLCKMNSINFQEAMYATIIKSYCSKLEVIKSEKIFNKMKLNKIKLKQRTYTHFIKMYNTLQYYDKLLDIYIQIKSNDIKLLIEDYIYLFDAFFKLSNIEFANKVLEDMQGNNICFNKNNLNKFKEIFKNNDVFKLTTISKKGLCNINKYVLKLIDITAEQRLNMILSFDIEINDNKLKLFKKFKKWLYNTKNINVIIDGANVGYFNNRPNKGNIINFKQIENIRKTLSKLGYNIIIILHQRHTQNMNESQKNLYNFWKNNNSLYCTPIGMNDDIFWLYASLYLSAYIITNDRMRDHKFNILDNHIQRWKNKYIIKYDFKNTKPTLYFPNNYSETLQNIDQIYWYFPFKIDQNKLQWFFICLDNLM